MADLIAITFDTREQAQDARRRFSQMSERHLVELEDSVIAYKNSKGSIQLDQTVNLMAGGAASGGAWGLLVGLLLSIPAGSAVLPIAASAFGAGFGALSARLYDYGLNDEMIEQLSRNIDAGSATLFILARNTSTKKMVRELEDFAGDVLYTSLPDNVEAELQGALRSTQRIRREQDIEAPPTHSRTPGP